MPNIMVLILQGIAGSVETRKMKDRATMEGRNTLMGLLGVALSAWLFGFTASPAMALSITGTYTDILSGSLGTTGPITGLVTGLGSSRGSSLGSGPNVTTLGDNFWSTTLGTGITADGFGTRADNATGVTLNSSSNFFAQDQVGDFSKYRVTHWAAAFSTNTAPVIFSLSGDDHAFLFIDGKRGLDDGGVEAIGAPVATAFALAGKHRLDLFFADAHVRQSGPEPARLLLFGATLVGLGAIVRRRMRAAATPSV